MRAGVRTAGLVLSLVLPACTHAEAPARRTPPGAASAEAVAQANPVAAPPALAPAPTPEPEARPEPPPKIWPKPDQLPRGRESVKAPALPSWACSCHPFLQQLLTQRRLEEAAGTAGKTTRVGWSALDLQVAAADPFQGLNDTQRRDALAYVAWKLAARDRSAAEAAALKEPAAAAADRLAGADVSAEALWIRARQLQLMHRTARLQAMTAKWHGRKIRLTGFVIPLERTAAGLTEFLLLPARPPGDRAPAQGPTQVVTVTSDTPFPWDGSSEVVVEGRVTVGGELPVEIPLAGSAEPAIVRSGYLLEAASVAAAESK